MPRKVSLPETVSRKTLTTCLYPEVGKGRKRETMRANEREQQRRRMREEDASRENEKEQKREGKWLLGVCGEVRLKRSSSRTPVI
jgi:hypothetical protein